MYICIFIIYCILKIVPDDTIQKVCSCLLASFWPWVLPVLLGFLAGVLEYLFVQQPPLARSFLKRPNSVISEYHAAALHQHAKTSDKYDICWRFIAYIIILLHAAYRSRHYPALLAHSVICGEHRHYPYWQIWQLLVLVVDLWSLPAGFTQRWISWRWGM